MARTLRYLLVLLFTSIAGSALAQVGEIYGTVTDEKGEPLVNASVQVTEGGIQKGGAVTDFDGKYSVKPLDPGNYQVRISYTGYKQSLITDVAITSSGALLNVKMEASSTTLTEVVVKESRYAAPLIQPRDPGSITTIPKEQIARMPTRNVTDIAASTPGVYQQRTGGGLSIGGGRGENTLYVIDGIQISGSSGINLTPGMMQSISVNAGGLSAKYGNATGGVVTINTIGASEKLTGSIFAEKSLDVYNRNQAGFSMSGPLLKKKDSTGATKPVLGFALGGDVTYDEDNVPTYYKNYVVKDDVMAQLQSRPLRAVPGPLGAPTLQNAAEGITKDDLETQKKRVNAEQTRIALNGKLDYKVSDNANLTLGVQGTFSSNRGYSRGLSLFAPEAIPDNKSGNYRGFLRFTQRFGKPTDKGLITNAFYSIQADYQKETTSTEDPNHGRDIFKYGYLGKFYEDRTPVYGLGYDSISGRQVTQLTPNVIASNARFERSELNPVLANYNSTAIDLLGFGPGSIRNFRGINGLLNGDAPGGVFGNLWSNVGSYQTGWAKSNADQFAASIDASFDLNAGKTKHAIEFGLYFQQRVERSYSLSSRFGGNTSLWENAYLLTNRHFLENLNRGPDADDAYYIINGVRYSANDVRSGAVTPGVTDTVVYAYRPNLDNQSAFDYNLRKKLGLNTAGTDYINVYELDPNMLSADMFSADELINNGRSMVGYQGFDYTGKRQGSVSFNDFFTQKDANGRYTRPIDAFRPNYIAGYITDNFVINDIYFNLGVRIDRYDANTKVLKDPYSLYDAYTVDGNTGRGAAAAKNFYTPDQKAPSNIGGDYVVYVNDNNSGTPSVIGYRNGDDWYDPTGKLVEDPTTLRNFSGGRDPQPYLIKDPGSNALPNIKSPNYDPNTSFTDYKPQVNVMPRLSFSFTIAEQTQFYGHYDVIVQRPSSGFTYATPIDYYFLELRGTQIGNPIGNTNLKPEKLFDYEVGFQQVITKSSAVTISGFYKERKDQIQVRPYLYAYPTTYYTYGNRDFSTTKGLRLKYDLRQLGNLRLFVAYTLQFAEGTGSDANSSAGFLSNFVTAGLPNLRFTAPLSVDSRHILSVNADYRYGLGEGPKIGGRPVFQNTGLNLLMTARSGEPYTRTISITNPTIAGAYQDSRLPFHYMLNLKLDKDFDISFRKKKGADGTPHRPRYLNAYVYVKNLLNLRDVLSVYSTTSRPDDDGFLNSANAEQTAAAYATPQSYFDLYSISRQNPNNVNLPRQINLGLQFNF